MIKLLESGLYILSETPIHTKILTLNKEKVYAWIYVKGIGEILVFSNKPHTAQKKLSFGKYRLYQVKNEKDLVDQIHLELFIGEGIWQGYLLPTGLPTSTDKRNRIIATEEVITKTHL